ncbi:hypothetical protein NSK_003768 [Nannochloropsis salina CCMP1776]|uniref:DUF2059 domain-containing protein n=1 Tax=Nannochloropsis salina CCMP1776 TaxID=1027361 RepID=A0A4D9D079_9STRA|nr:hypothetical protein NSK_003768 [Nannochloropsis salina CCMP1776]|eukprot:TFJ84736.1 hypothetical protein NSK_003768 [Nannochloropsis salina CCMP1776]
MASRLVHVSLALGTTLLILCLNMTMVGALKDTVKNRMKLADQYIFENPVEENMEGMARQHMLKMPDPKEREQLMRNLETLDMDHVRRITRHAMVKHFTTEELEFLINMYSTSVGKSVMAKIGAYSAELGPQIQEVMMPVMESNVEFYQEQERRAKRGELNDLPETIKLPPQSQKLKDGVYMGNGLSNAQREEM